MASYDDMMAPVGDYAALPVFVDSWTSCPDGREVYKIRIPGVLGVVEVEAEMFLKNQLHAERV